MRDAWRAARARRDAPPPFRTAAPVPTAASINGRGDGGLITPRRASIAVMPFVDRTAAIIIPGGPADGLAHDVITRLAQLRSLFVIAQGTDFALRDRPGPSDEVEIGRQCVRDRVGSYL